MSSFTQNPDHPFLTAFLSYSYEDRARIIPLVSKLQQANVEVHAFTETERPAEIVKKWIKENIIDADYLVFVVSDASLNRKEYVEREVGLAMQTLTDNKVLYPSIIPIQLSGTTGNYGTVQFQPRDFDTKKPIGAPIIWNDLNCIMMDRDGVDEAVQSILESNRPKTSIIKNIEFDADRDLFKSAMDLYEKLLPEVRMRDQPDDILDWLADTWNGENLDQDCHWINVLAVSHIGRKVVGLFWGSLHRRSGNGFIAFWGMLASHRRFDKGVDFFKEILQQLKVYESKSPSFLFAAERVNWQILDDFLTKALQVRMRVLRLKKPEEKWHQKISEPIGSQPSAIVQALKLLSNKSFNELMEQLKCYRRFELFATGIGFKGSFEREGMQLRAFARKDPPPPEIKLDTQIMADFVQPPIHLPVTEAGDSHLWLFGLLSNKQNQSSAEAVDWFYDVYLKEFIGEGRTKVPGWSEYMTEFKLRWRDNFVRQAEVRNLKIRDFISRYNILVSSVKEYWIHENVSKGKRRKWSI